MSENQAEAMTDQHETEARELGVSPDYLVELVRWIHYLAHPQIPQAPPGRDGVEVWCEECGTSWGQDGGVSVVRVTTVSEKRDEPALAIDREAALGALRGIDPGAGWSQEWLNGAAWMLTEALTRISRLDSPKPAAKAPHSDPIAAIDNRRIANYIVRFLRDRNSGELEDAISALTVDSYELLADELEEIIKWRGRPPNWTTP